MVSSISSSAPNAIQNLNQMTPPDLSTTKALENFDQGRQAQSAPPVQGLGENVDISA